VGTVLFLVDDYASHVHATLRIARKLQVRGHAVTYVGFGKTQAIVEAQGFAYAPGEGR
jgi:UDP:flavonoid glycosyltransferase YjiC (YdhE family)